MYPTMIMIKCGRIELSLLYPVNSLQSSDTAMQHDETVEFLSCRHYLGQKRLKIVQIRCISPEYLDYKHCIFEKNHSRYYCLHKKRRGAACAHQIFPAQSADPARCVRNSGSQLCCRSTRIVTIKYANGQHVVPHKIQTRCTPLDMDII